MTLQVHLGAPVYLVKGDDDVLREDAVVDLVHQLVGDGDRSLMVEDLGAARYEDAVGDYRIGPVVDAAQTPPFLTNKRVVIARNASVFSTKDAVAPLVAYLQDPLDTTSLVLVWEKGPRQGAQVKPVPKSLADAIVASGGVVVETSAGGRPADRKAWLDDQLADAPVKLDAGARKLVEDWLGEDAGRLVGLLQTLEGTYGTGARLHVDDVEPYLGQEGGLKPWDLTDAIDAGDVGLALARLHRMMDGGGMAGLQVMATLVNHYLRMVALDGADVADDRSAAALLGMKGSTFPAKKALDQGRRLGPERLAEFVRLLAQADLDLRGAKNYPGDVRDQLVMEVLVARLASRTPKAGAGRGAGRGRR